MTTETDDSADDDPSTDHEPELPQFAITVTARGPAEVKRELDGHLDLTVGGVETPELRFTVDSIDRAVDLLLLEDHWAEGTSVVNNALDHYDQMEPVDLDEWTVSVSADPDDWVILVEKAAERSQHVATYQFFDSLITKEWSDPTAAVAMLVYHSRSTNPFDFSDPFTADTVAPKLQDAVERLWAEVADSKQEDPVDG